jgi:hypothetical protein
MFNSIKIPVSQTIRDMCQTYLSTHALGKRGIEDGNPEQQLTGLIGQVVVSHFLKGALPDLIPPEGGFDGGIDIVHKEHKIDVKTMGRNSYVKGDYVNNFYVMQQNYESNVLVFCSYHKANNVIEICGWMYKKELDLKGLFYKKGTRRDRTDGSFFIFRQDNYEVKNKDLTAMDSLK